MIIFLIMEISLLICYLFTGNLYLAIPFGIILLLETLNWRSHPVYYYESYWYKKVFRSTTTTTFGQHIVTQWKEETMPGHVRHHEEIHCRQMKKLSVALFLALYFFNFLILFLRYWNFKKAYHSIYFEREARDVLK